MNKSDIIIIYTDVFFINDVQVEGKRNFPLETSYYKVASQNRYVEVDNKHSFLHF